VTAIVGKAFRLMLNVTEPLDAEMLGVARVFKSPGQGTAAAMGEAPGKDVDR
jgi:hypothetical protein